MDRAAPVAAGHRDRRILVILLLMNRPTSTPQAL
jgi:hypothetical protein